MPCVAVDLFCGIGGLTKGLELSGITVAAGIDLDATCAFAYEHHVNHFLNIHNAIEKMATLMINGGYCIPLCV